MRKIPNIILFIFFIGHALLNSANLCAQHITHIIPDTVLISKESTDIELLEKSDSKTLRSKFKLQNRIEENINPNQTIFQTTMLSDGTIWRDETEIISSRIYWSLGLVVSLEAIGYYALKDLQYYYPTTTFHTTNFSQDLKIYKQMDKYGHFIHAYFASETFSRMYRWSGFSGEKSVLYGTLTGWLWLLQIELADGFFKQWGFSWGDLIFNTIGSGFSAAQQLYPESFGGIQPKASYHKSEAFKNRTDNKGLKSLIDDYEGVTWWLAVNVYHYMPENIQSNYPDWLKPFGVAFGMSAEGIMKDPYGGQRELFVGLDFDLRKISYGEDSGILGFIKHNLNMIRLPMPAVKITQGGVWYGLYF